MHIVRSVSLFAASLLERGVKLVAKWLRAAFPFFGAILETKGKDSRYAFDQRHTERGVRCCAQLRRTNGEQGTEVCSR